ncbi:MAG TPA: Nif3-like dinuclear metal center hexameric protein [Planctomycetota bacterium]|nr:Nif3-like dinuclear metal center hexameric protein [Planctomycetota bacterium]
MPLHRLWIMMLTVLLGSLAHGEDLTAQQIIDRIKSKVGVDWSANTVDTIKAGSGAEKITGITTTMFPTLEVLKKSVAAGNNLIICHEPTFYNHKDDLTPLEKDDVQLAKLAYIKEHKLVVFRFHDHWHRMKPDGIMTGVAEALGWQGRARKGEQSVFDIETTTVGELAKLMKEKLKCSAVRVVGDPKMPCAKIALSPGAGATLAQIAALQRDDVDVLACGETREWETVEYTRDAIATGRKKALIVLGHSPSEEPGMATCAKWLEGFMSLPVKFIPCGDPFWAP